MVFSLTHSAEELAYLYPPLLHCFLHICLTGVLGMTLSSSNPTLGSNTEPSGSGADVGAALGNSETPHHQVG